MIWEVAVAKKQHERRKIVRRFRKRLENSPCLTDGLFVVSGFLWGIDCENAPSHLQFRLREILSEARETRQLAMARSLDKASEHRQADAVRCADTWVEELFDYEKQLGVGTLSCAFCEESPVGTYYLVNPRGGYALPEMWACWRCLDSAETGSLLADKRKLYLEEFGEVTAKAAHK